MAIDNISRIIGINQVKSIYNKSLGGLEKKITFVMDSYKYICEFFDLSI